jgi:hypothetical protein
MKKMYNYLISIAFKSLILLLLGLFANIYIIPVNAQEVWRYEIIAAARTGGSSGGTLTFNQTYENYAFMLDTATGKVWWKYEQLVRKFSTEKFVALKVDPAPNVTRAVPNHFKIYHNDAGDPYFYMIDTVSGQTWQFISVQDPKKNIDFTGFIGIEVEGKSFGPKKPTPK